MHRADGWGAVLEPVAARHEGIVKRLYFRGDAACANPEIYEFPEVRGSAARCGCLQTLSCRTRSDTC